MRVARISEHSAHNGSDSDSWRLSSRQAVTRLQSLLTRCVQGDDRKKKKKKKKDKKEKKSKKIKEEAPQQRWTCVPCSSA